MIEQPRSNPLSEEMLGLSEEYTRENTERLSRLLSEYTEKLSISLNEIEERGYRQFRFFLGSSAALTFLITIVFAVRTNFQINEILTAGFIAGVTLLSVRSFYTDMMRVKSLRRNIRRRANHLEQVVRRTSQIEEHLKLDLTNRIELDLRLTEAESLLDYARQINTNPFKL